MPPIDHLTLYLDRFQNSHPDNLAKSSSNTGTLFYFCFVSKGNTWDLLCQLRNVFTYGGGISTNHSGWIAQV